MPWQRDYARMKIDEAAGERWFCGEGKAASGMPAGSALMCSCAHSNKRGSLAARFYLHSFRYELICAVQQGDWRRPVVPFLGVSSLNFGPLATAAFFLAGVSRRLGGLPERQ